MEAMAEYWKLEGEVQMLCGWVPRTPPAAAQRQPESFEERSQLLPGSSLHTLETLLSQLCVWPRVLLTLFPRPSRLAWGAAWELAFPGALRILACRSPDISQRSHFECALCFLLSLAENPPIFGNHHQTNISLQRCQDRLYVLPRKIF